MADREEKLRAAKEKLDKFRKKKTNRDSPSPALSKGDEAGLSSYFGNGGGAEAASDTFASISIGNSQAPIVATSAQENDSFNFATNIEQDSAVTVINPTDSTVSTPNVNSDAVANESEINDNTNVAPEPNVMNKDEVSMIPETVQNFSKVQEEEIASSRVAIEGYKKEIWNLELLLQKERSEKQFALEHVKREQAEKENLQQEFIKFKDEATKAAGEAVDSSQQEDQMAKLRHQMTILQADIVTKNNTLELIVAEKSEFESKCEYLEDQCRLMLQEKQSLTQEIDTLRQNLTDYKLRVEDGKSAEELAEEKDRRAQETQRQLEELKSDKLELEVKLRRVCEEQIKERQVMKLMSSELEITKVHLTQLRGAGADATQAQQIANLSEELKNARNQLTTANSAKDKVVQERDRLAEQYRNYSKDLASQAERLSEQVRRYQDENARLVHRESGLVSQIEQMEKQLQKYVQGGKNITEEENNQLKEKCMVLETDARQAKEAALKLEQMYTERSDQVEDVMKRLAVKESKLNELASVISELQNSNEMLRSQAGETQIRPEILAAMESDKVAASRAMQQNNSMKLQIEELQKELVNLINSKAEALDQLEDYKRKVEKLGSADSEIKGLQEAIREREGIISGLRNQIRYLESEISPHREGEAMAPRKDLEEALNTIRSLNSINSELRSQLEVLSSQTRECSESRTQTATPGTPPPATLSTPNPESRAPTEESPGTPSHRNCETLGEDELNHNSEVGVGTRTDEESSSDMDQSTSSLSFSSDSFEQVHHGEVENHLQNHQSKDGKQDPIPGKEAEKSVSSALLKTPAALAGQQMAESPGVNLDTWRKLEERFISAMNRVAALSSDKEQLEHLVTRLQDETDTITDYIIMYQHQRKQQKMRLQEKDEQLQQLARDKSNLQSKLGELSSLVDQLLVHQDSAKGDETGSTEHVQQVTANGEQSSETKNNEEESTLAADGQSEAATTANTEESGRPVSSLSDDTTSRISSKADAKKIYKLLSEIQAESKQMVSTVENFEPWFFDSNGNNNSKVITV